MRLQVNQAKTLVNFPITVHGTAAPQCTTDWLAWCGLLINTLTLEVRSDYERYVLPTHTCTHTHTHTHAHMQARTGTKAI